MSNIAYVDWSLYIKCPNCKESFDLAEIDDDHVFSRAILSNKWDSLVGEDVCCTGCMHDFKIDEVEY